MLGKAVNTDFSQVEAYSIWSAFGLLICVHAFLAALTSNYLAEDIMLYTNSLSNNKGVYWDK